MRRSITIPGQNPPYPSLQSFTAKSNALVIVGANGSGKTRFGTFIDENNRDVHRVSAQKSLVMPDQTSTKSIEFARREFFYGNSGEGQTDQWLQTIGKNAYRYGHKPSTHLLSDYNALLTLLFSEEFESLLRKNYLFKMGGSMPVVTTKLERIIDIWESILPHRQLQIESSKISVTTKQLPTDDPNFFLNSSYSGSEMSDGERVIFYLISVAVSTNQESILIIDEPELHLHRGIIKKLFDKIEHLRPDVLFVYLTHDIDFASSRVGADKIWLRSFSGLYWKYEFISEQDIIGEATYLEILGSRKDIIFIEGARDSIDYQLYSLLFKDETLSPIGGCSEVIESTKAFNDSNSFHRLSARGIIDRDRRSDSEIALVNRNNITVLKLAEVENLFLLEDVIKGLARRLGKDPELVFTHVKQKIVDIFSQDIEENTIEYTIYFFKREITNSLGSATSWEMISSGLESAFTRNKYEEIYNSFKGQFQSYVANSDYLSILKYANSKRLIVRSELAIKCGLHNSDESIRNQIYNIIKLDPVEGPLISHAMISMLS